MPGLWIASLRFAVQDAKSRGCGLLLFGGDLFGGDNTENADPQSFHGNGANPRPYQIMGALAAFEEGVGGHGGMDLVGIEGNHDQPKTAGEASALAPVFAGLGGAARFSCQPEIINRGAVQIVTLPSPKRSQLAALVPHYAEMSVAESNQLLGAALIDILRGLHAQLDLDRPSILLAHISLDVAEVRGSIMEGRDITIPLCEIPDFTLGAFGHIHEAQDFGKHARPNFFYAGSSDRCDFGEEGQAKSYVIMDTESGTWERVEIGCREYRTIRYDYRGETPSTTCPADLFGAICRAKITRPESVKADLPAIEKMIRDAGAFDYYGAEQTVEREVAIRNEAIKTASGLTEQLEVWHKATDCAVGLEDLSAAAGEIESEVAS
jgi:DNA repair exonuclease SbcCD nuclease subunit